MKTMLMIAVLTIAVKKIMGFAEHCHPHSYSHHHTWQKDDLE
jgi:hypothetical protein